MQAIRLGFKDDVSSLPSSRSSHSLKNISEKSFPTTPLKKKDKEEEHPHPIFPTSSSEAAPSWAEQYMSDRKREAGIREGVLAQPKSLPTVKRRRRSTLSVLSKKEGGGDADGHDEGDGRDKKLERKSNFSLDLSEEPAGTSLGPVPQVSRICTKMDCKLLKVLYPSYI